MSNYMQNEFERDNPEESEYHFSDEGVYDTGLEEEVKDQVTISDNSGMANQLSSYRRFVIVGGSFAGVLLVVYLFLSPSSNPPTEIKALTAAQSTVTAPDVSVAPAKPVAQPKDEISALKKMAAAVQERFPSHAANREPTSVATPKTDFNNVQPSPLAVSNTAPGVSPATVAPLADSNLPATLTSAAESISTSMGMSSNTVRADQDSKAILDRLAALEEANTKLIAQLHSEYSRKMTDVDVQDKVVEEQMRAMANKISSLETQINQLLQVINKQQQQAPAVPATTPTSDNSTNSNSAENNAGTPPGAASNPTKPPYSVQAIIPGRAWLKTESGETITVAEGDILKNFGRVTKIDPYDGTIQIDTGSKMLLLTYGNGDYA